MPTTHRIIVRNSLIAIGVFSVFSGWWVPEFYDWTGADQSRPSPWMWLVPLAAVVIVTALTVGLCWVPFDGWESGAASERQDAAAGSARGSERWQFSLRWLLIATCIVAVATAATMHSLWMVATGCYVAVVAIGVLRPAVLRESLRLPLVVLMVALYAPFLWLFRGDASHELLWHVLGLPGFLPGVWIGSHLGFGPLTWVSTAVSALIVWVAQRWSVRGAALGNHRLPLGDGWLMDPSPSDSCAVAGLARLGVGCR